MLQLHGFCGMMTEEVIEALHRKQNSVKNLTSSIRNEEARMTTVLDNQHQRWIQRDHDHGL